MKKKVSGTFFLQHRALRATEKGVRYLYLLTDLGGTYTTTVRTETADFADHADKLIKTKVSGTFFSLTPCAPGAPDDNPVVDSVSRTDHRVITTVLYYTTRPASTG